jgi:hypothetical protein
MCAGAEEVALSTVETTPKPTATAPAASTAGDKPMVIIDLGKRSRKQIKRLRKGSGRLVDRVVGTVDQLAADGEVDANHQIVVVVVKQDDGRKGLFW